MKKRRQNFLDSQPQLMRPMNAAALIDLKATQDIKVSFFTKTIGSVAGKRYPVHSVAREPLRSETSQQTRSDCRGIFEVGAAIIKGRLALNGLLPAPRL
jgi:hypothetical protein